MRKDANDPNARSETHETSGTSAAPPPNRPRALRPEHLRAVRLGHGANCSSVGSVVDTLFLGAAAGAALFAAVCAAVETEARTTPDEKTTPDDDAPRDQEEQP